MIRVFQHEVQIPGMSHEPLKSITPVDGRYASKVDPLRSLTSEYGLIRFRVLVEIRWLQWLADEPGIGELKPFTGVMKDLCNRIVDEFDIEAARRVKDIEKTTNHDVKACEYYLRERLEGVAGSDSAAGFIHFGCTSEDINNLAYALMLRHARDDVLSSQLGAIENELMRLAGEYAEQPMLSRTHGQTASPTTVGKEVRNVQARLERARRRWQNSEVFGKFNGAVGTFAAHHAAYPDLNWPDIASRFVESLGLTYNPLTTQIEPHDWIAEYFQALSSCNTIMIDFCRDVWGYISLGYFRQNVVATEVGSSTMPHKVNPIDFENAEGNFGIANALAAHFAASLPISRWQRDLTDSTVLRNLGVALAHSSIGWQSLSKGLGKLALNQQVLADDLADRWEVLGEAVQTVMRRYGLPEPYEQLKALSRGRTLDRALLGEFIDSLNLPAEVAEALKAMQPADYTGLAEALAQLPSQA